MSSWIQLCSCPRDRLLLSVRHARVAPPSCWVQVVLSRLDGGSQERMVHSGPLSHDRHLSWIVRWLDELNFAVRLMGGLEARYRLDGSGSAKLLIEGPIPDVSECERPALRSSEMWLKYFEENDRRLLDIPWERGAEASAAELEPIAASMAGFQLGESSEGRHLMASAREYAERTGDADYLEAVKLFIREEQRHAATLARFMQSAGILVIRKSWPDTVFRALRQMAGLELSISVLITAEIIAEVYYPALREATGSAALRRACDQIIDDELRHVEFQSERLALLRMQRSDPALAVTHGLQRFLFWGTCLVVWAGHGRAFRAGGYGFGRFWKESWARFAEARRVMDPRTFRGRS